MWRKLKKNKILYLEVTVQTQYSWRANDPSSFSGRVLLWRNSGPSEICWVVARQGNRWPIEHFCSEKAVTTQRVTLDWALIESWKERTCLNGRVQFNKLYLKVLSIFCKIGLYIWTLEWPGFVFADLWRAFLSSLLL